MKFSTDEQGSHHGNRFVLTMDVDPSRTLDRLTRGPPRRRRI